MGARESKRRGTLDEVARRGRGRARHVAYVAHVYHAPPRPFRPTHAPDVSDGGAVGTVGSQRRDHDAPVTRPQVSIPTMYILI